jgi:hypothetical protein
MRPLVCFALLVLLLLPTGCTRLDRDTRALRDGLTKATGGAWEEQVEISAGFFTVGLAKAIVACTDAPPEARTALSALRGAEVGVYRQAETAEAPAPSAFLSSADRAMAEQGWERIVGVVNRHDRVAVYVPAKLRSPKDMRFCVAVMQERQLVLVKATGNPEPLVRLASKQLAQERPLAPPTRL